jgi:hypothetical protein
VVPLAAIFLTCGVGELEPGGIWFFQRRCANVAGDRCCGKELHAMKRDPALALLSRDHHQALVVAQRLRRATPGMCDTARTGFAAYWEARGRAHFRLEELVLLPAYAAHGDPYHPLVARVLCDHLAIRRSANALVSAPAPTAAVLHELGVRLADHVRFEEREVFPLIERAMPAERLAAVAAAMEDADGRAPTTGDGKTLRVGAANRL